MTRQLLIAIFLLCCAAFVLYFALSATPQALAQAPAVQPAATPAPAKSAPEISAEHVTDFFRAKSEVSDANAHQQAAVFRMILDCGADWTLGWDPRGVPVCVAKPPAVPAKPEAKR
jgi:hypothetical protein